MGFKKRRFLEDVLFELGDLRCVIIWSWCSRHFHWRLRTADCSASQINFHDSSRRTWVAPTWSRLKICLCILRLNWRCSIFCHLWIFWDFWGSAKTLYRVAFTKTNKLLYYYPRLKAFSNPQVFWYQYLGELANFDNSLTRLLQPMMATWVLWAHPTSPSFPPNLRSQRIVTVG